MVALAYQKVIVDSGLLFRDTNAIPIVLIGEDDGNGEIRMGKPPEGEVFCAKVAYLTMSLIGYGMRLLATEVRYHHLA